tara:strand:- start:981 stop:1898 length:918 start_codon:yes stop_codon:yes gene_type:complete
MSKKKPLVTYHVNTYNKKRMLKNLLLSFNECNVYENYEWVIVDQGSTDGTVEFLKNVMEQSNKVKVIFDDELEYFEKLRSIQLYPRNNNKKANAVFGKAKNDARKIAKGKYFIDIADDHQFVRKVDWVTEMIDVCESEGVNTVASVIYRGLTTQRINKANNATGPVKKSDKLGVEYYVCKHKHYDDYGMMPKSVYNKIGPYFQVEAATDPGLIEDWKSVDYKSYIHYEDYLARTKKMNLKKIFLKYPYAIDFPNPWHSKLQRMMEHYPVEQTAVPAFEEGKLQGRFSHLDRAVSSDEMILFQGIR